MVTFLTVTLFVSMIGLCSIVAVKRFELSTGHVVFAGVRPAIGAFLSACLHWIEGIAPNLLKQWLYRAYVLVRAVAHRLVALGVLWTERTLEQTLRMLKHKTALPRKDAPQDASPFLVEVAKHKRYLLRQAPKKEDRMIHEEL
jgi:hypothetical protein